MECEVTLVGAIKAVGDAYGFDKPLIMREVLSTELNRELDEVNAELNADYNESIGFVWVRGSMTYIGPYWMDADDNF